MLLELLPTDPHLVKGAQTRHDAAADPAAEFPLRDVPRRLEPHPCARIYRL